MVGSKLKKSVYMMLIMMLVISVILPASPSVGSAASDNKGHWAEKQITDWQAKALIKGYADGTFKPNNSITRAEFAALVNRAFGLSKTANVSFSDVNSSDWFYVEVAKAKEAGYIEGYQDGTFKPNNSISRQEVAVILAKLFKLDTTVNKEASLFKDADLIPQWSIGSISAVVKKGFMKGYPDGSFKPVKSITRAEAIVTLDPGMKEGLPVETPVTPTTPSSSGGGGGGGDGDTNADRIADLNAGSSVNGNIELATNDTTYGPQTGTTQVTGNITISSEGITLRNTNITGNLVIAEGVGEGEVYLQNVTVNGTTTVLGGGENSIYLNNSTLLTVIVNKENGTIRLVAQGSTTVQQMTLESGAILQNDATGNEAGFGNVALSNQIPAGARVALRGSFETVDVFAASIAIDVPAGSSISSLVLNAIAAIVGNGIIESADINADGVTFERMPGQINVSEGVQAPAQRAPFTLMATNESVTLNVYRDMGNNVTLADFNVSATLDGVDYELQNLAYDNVNHKFTFTPISLEENYGKTFNVTVSPTGESPIFAGEQNVSIELYGFAGYITDVNEQAVDGMIINFRQGLGATDGQVIATAVTDVNGYYSIYLPLGIYTGELQKSGFITTYLVGVSAENVFNTDQDATAIRVPDGEEIRIVLTWDEHPEDLDSHLIGPGVNGGQFHTWYSNEVYDVDGTTYADLDHDDTTSYGPETTTIRQQTDGTYKFIVHHYSGESTLRLSGAKVEVYKGEGTQPIATYRVPAGDGTEVYWVVFEMNGNTLTGINTMADHVDFPVDRSGLQDLITEAQDIHDNAVEGTDIGEYAEGSKAVLQAAIDAAQLVYDDLNATQDEVIEAMDNLYSALNTFEAGQVLPSEPTAPLSIEVTGNDNIEVRQGQSTTAEFTALDQEGNILDSDAVTWSIRSDVDFGDSVTVDAYGVVTVTYDAYAIGNEFTVVATSNVTGEVYGEKTVTLSVYNNPTEPSIPQKITVNGNSSIEVRQGQSTTSEFTALDQEGNILDSDAVTWSIRSDVDFGDSVTVDAYGVVTVTYDAYAIGNEFTVVATSNVTGEVYGEKTVTLSVYNSPTPGSISISGVSTIQLPESGELDVTYSAQDQNNYTLDSEAITWSVRSDVDFGSTVTVDAYGVVTVTYDAYLNGNTFIIRATSTVNGDVYGEKTVTLEAYTP